MFETFRSINDNKVLMVVQEKKKVKFVNNLVRGCMVKKNKYLLRLREATGAVLHSVTNV